LLDAYVPQIRHITFQWTEAGNRPLFDGKFSCPRSVIGGVTPQYAELNGEFHVSSDAKWEFIVSLDERYLKGGVMLSEWTASLVRDADTAFCSGAHLSAILILSSQAAVECHLRYEYSSFHNSDRLGFYDLIEQSPIDAELRVELHRIRRFRNRWVHMNDPHDDDDLLARPEYHEKQLEEFATFTIEQLRRVIYLEQCV